MRIVRLLTTILILCFASVVHAQPPGCTITGVVINPSTNQPYPNGYVYFDSLNIPIQTIGGFTIQPLQFSVRTDSSGNITPTVLPQGLKINITIGGPAGQTELVQIPALSTDNLSDILGHYGINVPTQTLVVGPSGPTGPSGPQGPPGPTFAYVAFSFPGIIVPNESAGISVPADITFPANFSSLGLIPHSTDNCGTAPSQNDTYTVSCGSTIIGTIIERTICNGTTSTATFATTSGQPQTCPAGNLLSIFAGVPVSGSDIEFTLNGHF